MVHRVKSPFSLLKSIFLKKISLIILKLELKSLIKPSKKFSMQFSVLWWPLYRSYGPYSQFWRSYCHIARKNYVLKKTYFFQKILKNLKKKCLSWKTYLICIVMIIKSYFRQLQISRPRIFWEKGKKMVKLAAPRGFSRKSKIFKKIGLSDHLWD